MSAEVKTRIAEELALLTQLVPFPSEPFGYGSDISCDTDCDPTMAEVSGNSTLALAQALVRRLDCPRGQNPDDPDYGIGLRQYLNSPKTANEINALGGQIRLELLKDDRVDTLTVLVVPSQNGTILDVTLAVMPKDRSVGGFKLTLNASSAAILIAAIQAER